MVSRWPQRYRKDMSQARWAFGTSLLLHALPIVILGSLSQFAPTVGPEARFDFLWIAPPSAQPSPAGDDETQADAAEVSDAKPEASNGPVASTKTPAAPSSQAAPQDSGSTELLLVKARAKAATPGTERPSTIKKTTSAPKEAPRAGDRSKDAEDASGSAEPILLEKPAAHGDVPVPVTQPAPLAPVLPETKTADRPREKLDAPVAKMQRLAQVKEESPPQPASAASHPALQPTLPTPLTPAAVRATLPSTPPVTAAVPSVVQSPVPPPVQTPARTPAAVAAPAPAHKPAQAGDVAGVGNAAKGAPSKTASAVKDTDKVNEMNGKAPKEQTRTGMIVPAIRGDLKLVIAGNSDIKVLISFRAYPKSRRDKVQTKAEARRELKVTPIVVKTRQGMTETVVEKAGEGIYLFRAEPQSGAGKATFTLKLFEGGSREKVSVIGSSNLPGKSVLTKVLMPEGILWDDDSAFTGTLEDSDSVTKFNAQTGVYWKEYHE